MTTEDPEVRYYIARLGNGTHGAAKTTRGPDQEFKVPEWRPLGDGDGPVWFQVSQEIHDEWVAEGDVLDADRELMDAVRALLSEADGADYGDLGPRLDAVERSLIKLDRIEQGSSR